MKDATQTSTTRPDANTGQYQDIFRKILLGGIGGLTGNSALTSYAGPYAGILGQFDPTAQKDAIRSNFNTQRAQAVMQGNDLATKAGAYGGDRSAVLQAALQQGIGQNENAALAGVDQEGFQRLLAMLGLASGSPFGQPGTTSTQTMPSNPFGTIAGLAATAGGLGWKPFA